MRALLLGLLSIFFAGNAAAAGLAVRDSTMPGVRCELTKVYRKNGVLTVRFALITDRTVHRSRYPLFFRKDGEDPSYILDEEKGIKYYALSDKEGNPLASSERPLLDDNERSSYWMKLPAPPEEIKTISVALSGCEPFDEIEVQDR